jgi:hypothetical protein
MGVRVRPSIPQCIYVTLCSGICFLLSSTGRCCSSSFQPKLRTHLISSASQDYTAMQRKKKACVATQREFLSVSKLSDSDVMDLRRSTCDLASFL